MEKGIPPSEHAPPVVVGLGHPTLPGKYPAPRIGTASRSRSMPRRSRPRLGSRNEEHERHHERREDGENQEHVEVCQRLRLADQAAVDRGVSALGGVGGGDPAMLQRSGDGSHLRGERLVPRIGVGGEGRLVLLRAAGDRKSTRLNSSHLGISYAVFCLKKKNKREGKSAFCISRLAEHG